MTEDLQEQIEAVAHRVTWRDAAHAHAADCEEPLVVASAKYGYLVAPSGENLPGSLGGWVDFESWALLTEINAAIRAQALEDASDALKAMASEHSRDYWTARNGGRSDRAQAISAQVTALNAAEHRVRSLPIRAQAFEEAARIVEGRATPSGDEADIAKEIRRFAELTEPGAPIGNVSEESEEDSKGGSIDGIFYVRRGLMVAGPHEAYAPEAAEGLLSQVRASYLAMFNEGIQEAQRARLGTAPAGTTVQDSGSEGAPDG